MDQLTMTLTESKLEAMLQKAAKDGARAALAEVGLADDEALADFKDFRNLMKIWRQAKKTIGETVFKTIIRKLVEYMLMIFMVGVAFKFGFKFGL